MFYKGLTSRPTSKDDITHSRPKCVQMFSTNAQFIYLSVLQRIKKSYSFHTKKLEALGHCIGLPPPTHVLYQCRNPNPDPYP